MSRLEISLLGSFRVTLDAAPVTRFGADTARALLAYLTMQAATPHRRETLAGLLWPDQPESEARHNLSQALLRLRTAIGDRDAAVPFLLATRETIQFSSESDYWLDVSAFEEALAFSMHHGHRRVEDCAACAERLRAAAALYGGAFLDGFSLGSALFEGWVVVERERLHRQALEALGQLAAHHEGQGAYPEAVRYARRALALEPWHEAGHRQVMRGLALGGDRSAALMQYEAYCRVLQEELAVEPAAETRRLYERIRDGELAPRSPEAQARLRHNLPTFPGPLIGRETELEEIHRLLSDPACRLLTLIGPGGIGKTHLAVEAARLELARCEDGAFFVPLAPVRSVDAIVSTVCRALGLSFYDIGDPQQQLLGHLRGKRMLLVVDNLEQLVAGSALPEHDQEEPGARDSLGLIAEILRVAPGVKVVVTSRSKLNLREEYVFTVRGLAAPDRTCTTPQEALANAAIQLFLQVARRARVRYEPTPDDLKHIARVCRLVEGMPLAILLAASWIGMLSPAEIGAEIARGLDFLETDLRDMPERHRSVRAAFDASWRLLTDPQRRAFARLCVFRGGFARDAAGAVAGVSLRVLKALVDQSLLQQTALGRYEVHELLRQYGEGQLDAMQGERRKALDLHCAHYTGAVEQWEADLKGGRQRAALSEMDVELENVRTAWSWAVERGYVGCVNRMAEGLGTYHDARFRHREGEAAFREAAEGLEAALAYPSGCEPSLSIPTPDGPELRGTRRAPDDRATALRALAKVLAWQSLFDRELGSRRVPLGPLQRSLALLERPELAGQDTRAERAFVLHGLGWSTPLSERERIGPMWEQSLALSRALGDRWGIARILRALSHQARWTGDFDKARQRAEESLSICRALGDSWGVLRTGYLLCRVCAYQGEAERAVRLAREYLALWPEVAGPSSVWRGLFSLGEMLVCAGQYAEAVAQLEESLAISRDLEPRRHLFARSRNALASAHMHLGQYGKARAHGQAALALAQEIDREEEVALARLVLGCLALAEPQHPHRREEGAGAEELLAQSVAGLRASEHYKVGEALAALGYAARRLCDRVRAERCLYEVFRMASEMRIMYPLMLALPPMAQLEADRGRAARAVELYALASRYPVVANSRWFEDVAGRQIADAAAALPPHVVADAQARGEARDMWGTVRQLLSKLGEK